VASCNGAGACTVCGDGIVSAGETCDDFNAASGDGCNSSCTIEPGYMCVGQPSVCVGICGDGIIRAGETCDDANVTNGDGCSSSCSIEVGFSCTGQPSLCNAICGDGIVRGTEGCDDGNTTSGDGCSSTCTIEASCALLRVNELVTGTTASPLDEYIEVFNPCYVSVNISGWRLVYRAAAGTSDTVFVTWSATTIPARSYLLYVGTAYVGTNDGVYNSGSMAAAGGGIAVRNSVGTIIDSVGYGTATNIYVEGAAAPAPPGAAPPGRSIGRFPNGVDTNQNSVDFHITTSVTPRAANN
jgi:cysteine-rich repeat protein